MSEGLGVATSRVEGEGAAPGRTALPTRPMASRSEQQARRSPSDGQDASEDDGDSDHGVLATGRAADAGESPPGDDGSPTAGSPTEQPSSGPPHGKRWPPRSSAGTPGGQVCRYVYAVRL